MDLYFVRHGQSMGNMTNDYSTPAHDQLSPNGWQQAERLGERLGECAFDAIYVSPLRRALETITPYLRRHARKAQAWPELAEACWQADRDAAPPVRQDGVRPFVPDTSLRDLFGPRPEPTFWAVDGETYREGLARIARTGSLLLERHGGRDEVVLVVGHEHAGGRLIELLLDIAPSGRFAHANTGLTCLSQNGDGTFSARFINRL